MIKKREFYINGQWTAPAQAHDFDVIDPSTEEVAAVISLGSQDDTDAAVAAAKAAFPAWSAKPLAERVNVIKKFLEIYNERAQEMADAMTTEMGAPKDWSLEEQVGAGSWHTEGFLEALEHFEFERRFTPTEMHVMDPIGVVGLITPWNWPMNQICLKVIPALAVGCTMVLKPSEIAPLSALLFAEMMDEAGVPAGVFNLVNGDGPGVGTQLSTHPDVAMISFTGSTRAGIAISKAAADTLKRVSLELGGKGANIVFADADDNAVTRGAMQCFNNSGQSCNAPTRMLVERSRYDAAVEDAVKAAETRGVASGHEHGTHIGPVVSELQFDKIQDLIQKGIDEGARLAAGGTGRPAGLNRGYFVRPTVFADVTNDMTIAQTEIFGPVLSIIPFDTEEEAIAIANDSPYGLTHYVQSQDDTKRMRVARRLHAGMIQTNGKGLAKGSPFGGVKASGNGREGGHFGLEDFCEVKVITAYAD